jgi:hypothetical protein
VGIPIFARNFVLISVTVPRHVARYTAIGVW